MEQKEEEINVLKKKKTEYRYIIETLKDKNKTMEDVMMKSE